MNNRYARQTALPEIGLLGQEKLSQAAILMVGCGGLGAAALPYLTGAGIGHIIIADHDTIDITNIHRQTIYKTSDAGKNKALATQEYLENLNPDIRITAITSRITKENASEILSPLSMNLILDGSDNFETKSLLNDLSISAQIPLITASVNQWGGQIGIFRGYEENSPCYRCLFPEFPTDARNCNEAGILGTSAGIIGLYQAHIAMFYILGTEDYTQKNVLTLNLKTIRSELMRATKEPGCPHCTQNQNIKKPYEKETQMIELIPIENLNDCPTTIIDVRQPEEITNDPLTHPFIETPPINIPLPEFVNRINDLPTGQRLAFLCAGNIRSRQAAEYLSAKGYANICILDKFSL